VSLSSQFSGSETKIKNSTDRSVRLVLFCCVQYVSNYVSKKGASALVAGRGLQN
jgi:hypothetical protein